MFLIVNAALGAGLLNFPQAFDQAGKSVTFAFSVAGPVGSIPSLANVCLLMFFCFEAGFRSGFLF